MSHLSSIRLLSVFAPLFLVAAGCALDGDPDAISATQQADSVFRWSDEARVSNWSSGRSPALGSLGGVVYMVHAGGCVTCTTLYWGKFSGTTWQGDQLITNALSDATPSLSGFSGFLYMAYNHGTSVFLTRYNPTTNTWAPGSQLPFQSNGAPGLAAFGSKLYFVYADPSTAQLHMRTMDASETLSADQPLAFQFSFSPPSLSVFQNRLYMVHAASGGMVYNSFDGTSWGADLRLSGGLGGANQASPGTPALATFGGLMHLLHNEPTTGDTIWWSEFDGASWAVEQSLPGPQLGHPSLAPGATKLVMSHGSTASDLALFYATYR